MPTSVTTSIVSNTAVAKRSHSQEHVDHLDFYFFKYLFMHMNVLPPYMYMYPVHAWSEGIRTPGTGVRDG